MTELAALWGADLCGVTKFCLGDPGMLKLCAEGGIKGIADSNAVNFFPENALAKQNKRTKREKLVFPDHFHKSLIKTRISDIRQWGSLPRNKRAHRLFISHRALLEEVRCIPGDEKPEVVLIAEMGDLKEGLFPEEILSINKDFPDLPILGVSANFACLSGAVPSLPALKNLKNLACEIQSSRNLEAPFVSVGGTVMHSLMRQETPQKGLFQELRCGEGLFFGFDSSGGGPVPGFETDTMTFYGEILEVAEKEIPAAKLQESALTALGDHAHERPPGQRKSAVLDFGILGADEFNLFPFDSDTLFAGQTFDFTVLDITNSVLNYKPGDLFPFRVNYKAGSFLFMNPFIHKVMEGKGKHEVT